MVKRLLILCCIFMFYVVSMVGSFPPVAIEFYGTAKDFTMSDVPAGTNITAYDENGTLCGFFIVQYTGYYGLLSCNGDDTSTGADEGAVAFDTISFRINNLSASTSNDSSWEEGEYKRVDIILNHAPELDFIGQQNLTEDVPYYYDVNATDLDNDTLRFIDFTNLFDIDEDTGVISFTPTNDDVGVYVVRITVTDGYLYDFEDVVYVVYNTNDVPVLLHTIPNYVIDEADNLTIDINCSDVDQGDSIRYLINDSRLSVDSSTGIITWTPGNWDVGLNTFNVSCLDNSNTGPSQVFNVTVNNINQIPSISAIGSRTAYTGIQFTLQVQGYDGDNDTLTYDTDTEMFEIDPDTGLIQFTPDVSNLGVHEINVSVSDGNFTTWQLFNLTILLGPYCGNGVCDPGENCLVCEVDCGECQAPPGQAPIEVRQDVEYPGYARPVEGAGEAGGTGGTGEGRASGAIGFCQERWSCTPWSNCTPNNLQVRSCYDLNTCGTDANKPNETRNCHYIPTCTDGLMNGNETGIDCGGLCPPCMTCFDGVRNQGETGIDCGGPCPPCKISKEEKLPILEKTVPPLAFLTKRYFPWILLLVILAINIITMGSDFLYRAYLRRKKFEDYKERIRKYRPLKLKIYKFNLNLFSLGLVSAVYIYYAGAYFLEFIWLWFILLALTGVLISYLTYAITFSDKRRKRKEERLLRSHEKELIDLLRIETTILYELETNVCRSLLDIVTKKGTIDTEIYTIFKKLYHDLSQLRKFHHAYISQTQDHDIVTHMVRILKNKAFRKAKKEYPEFIPIIQDLKILKNCYLADKVITEIEEDFMVQMKAVSADTHLMSVIRSVGNLTDVYNQLVDLYVYFKEKLSKEQKEDEIHEGMEKDYMKIVDDIAKNKQMIENIKQNREVLTVYNVLVDIYNQYNRRKDLKKKIVRTKEKADTVTLEKTEKNINNDETKK